MIPFDRGIWHSFSCDPIVAHHNIYCHVVVYTSYPALDFEYISTIHVVSDLKMNRERFLLPFVNGI